MNGQIYLTMAQYIALKSIRIIKGHFYSGSFYFCIRNVYMMYTGLYPKRIRSIGKVR